MPAWIIAVILAVSGIQHPNNQCERTSPTATEWYHDTDARPVAAGYGCTIITVDPIELEFYPNSEIYLYY